MHTYANNTKIADIAASDFFRDPEGIRTPDRLLRRQMLYPAELPNLFAFACAKLGFFRDLCNGGLNFWHDI